jgi:hypothetical protein
MAEYEEYNANPFSTYRPFAPTKDQNKTKEEELEQTLAQLPLLKERLEYLDKKIAFYGDVESVVIDLAADPQTHRNQLCVNKLMKAELQSERSFLLTRVEKLKK